MNNAEIFGPIAAKGDLSIADCDRVCGVNQHAVFLGMKAVTPSMLRVGIGSIVNISSLSGMVANVGTPSVAYVAREFAVHVMTKARAIEYAKHNIRVNSVHAGYIQRR